MEDTSDAANMTCHGIDNGRRTGQLLSFTNLQQDQNKTNQLSQLHTNVRQQVRRGKRSSENGVKPKLV